MDKDASEFYDVSLRETYEICKIKSEEYRKKLDKCSSDIRNLESFLRISGFHVYAKNYGKEKTITLSWTDKRLKLGDIPLIESKADKRMEAYPYLHEFLLDITKYHEVDHA